MNGAAVFYFVHVTCIRLLCPLLPWLSGVHPADSSVSSRVSYTPAGYSIGVFCHLGSGHSPGDGFRVGILDVHG